jgi:hypothetical protein
MEQTDTVSAELKVHEAALADVKREAAEAKNALVGERTTI